MKQLINYVLTGTLILAAMACQREPLTPNGGLEGSDVKEVTTQFVLNIAAAPTTKMSANVVQQDNIFRGIDHSVLYTYKTGLTGANPYVLSTITAEDKMFDFGTFFASGGLDNTSDHNQEGGTATKPGSKRVLQLSIPVGTDAVLFYGRATKASGVSDAEYGYTLTKNLSGTPKDTKFAAVKILDSDATVAKYDATARLMIFIINYLLNTSVLDDVDTDHSWTLPATTWGKYGHRYEYDKYPSTTRYTEDQCLNHSLEGLEEILGKCYYLFTYIVPASTPTRPHGEYRAGSSDAVKTMILDMYKVISAASEATPTTSNEANAKRVAEAVLDKALLFFNQQNGQYFNLSTIKARLLQYNIIADSDTFDANFGNAQDLNGYPFEDFGIPVGAAQLGFVVEGQTRPAGHPQADTQAPTDEFFYYHPNKPLVNYTMTSFEPRKYLYPAELMYYVNSPIRTTGTDVTNDSFPDGVNPWNADASWTDWTFPGKVEGSTRGVAVANSINYGVAMLKSSVKLAPSDLTVFEDNRAAITNNTEPNKTINVSAASLQLRGVLVGGVNPRMNWQFTRYFTSSGNHESLGDLSLFDGVIYDHSIPSSTIPTPEDEPNYTLVYDNYNSSQPADNQNDVYIALEFVNGGDAFYGRDNLIPSGGVFYLVAKLDKPSLVQSAALPWPTDHHIPPLYGIDGVDDYTAAEKKPGDSKQIGRIFIQDFMTTVTFKLNRYSLQHAYYSTPDLRASQMSLGLSVDLQWAPGLEFNDVIL